MFNLLVNIVKNVNNKIFQKKSFKKLKKKQQILVFFKFFLTVSKKLFGIIIAFLFLTCVIYYFGSTWVKVLSPFF